MIKTIYSISIAVEDLDEAVKNYEAFLRVKPTYSSGYEVGKELAEAIMKVQKSK
jgi:hypothetical protein